MPRPRCTFCSEAARTKITGRTPMPGSEPGSEKLLDASRKTLHTCWRQAHHDKAMGYLEDKGFRDIYEVPL